MSAVGVRDDEILCSAYAIEQHLHRPAQHRTGGSLPGRSGKGHTLNRRSGMREQIEKLDLFRLRPLPVTG